MGVTKDTIVDTFKSLSPNFEYDEASTHEVKWQSERLMKAMKIAGRI